MHVLTFMFYRAEDTLLSFVYFSLNTSSTHSVDNGVITPISVGQIAAGNTCRFLSLPDKLKTFDLSHMRRVNDDADESHGFRQGTLIFHTRKADRMGLGESPAVFSVSCWL